jgi:carbamoylphosphate synthase small subunit
MLWRFLYLDQLLVMEMIVKVKKMQVVQQETRLEQVVLAQPQGVAMSTLPSDPIHHQKTICA